MSMSCRYDIYASDVISGSTECRGMIITGTSHVHYGVSNLCECMHAMTSSCSSTELHIYNCYSFVVWLPHSFYPSLHYASDLLCIVRKGTKGGIPLDMIYCEIFNSSLTSDAIWRQKWVNNGRLPDGNKPYLNHSLLSNSMVQYHSHEGDFNIDPLAISNRNLLDNYLSNPIFCKLPRGQWKKLWQWQHWVHGKVSMP